MHDDTHDDEGERKDPVTLANPKQAWGDRKRKIHLVPAALVIGAALAAAEGGRKYGPYNWRKTKVQATTYVVGAIRHLLAYLDGEELDPESDVLGDGTLQKHHLDGAAMSLAILMDAREGDFLIDDRPPPGPAPRLLRDPRFEGGK